MKKLLPTVATLVFLPLAFAASAQSSEQLELELSDNHFGQVEGWSAGIPTAELSATFAASNRAQIKQTATNSYAAISQQGEANIAAIIQHSSASFALISQSGSNNAALITQR